jgi:hypothetical protein
MVSFIRGVVLCLLMIVLAPRPAHAWFELLDYLSGPGPFYGYKIDFRVWCAGEAVPLRALGEKVEEAFTGSLSHDEIERGVAHKKWLEIVKGVTQINQRLDVIPKDELDMLTSERERLFPEPASLAPALSVLEFRQRANAVLDTFHRTTASIASTGIFISLCGPEKTRSWAVEVGFTSLQAMSNANYAHDHTIRLNMITGGLSYRVPLPVDRDFIDVGLSAGQYRFSSRGFEGFSGMIVEPFVDLHGPTNLIHANGLKKLGALITVRLGLVWFPGGFDGEQFASSPSKPQRISGREATPSATIFFNLAPLLRHRAKSF